MTVIIVTKEKPAPVITVAILRTHLSFPSLIFVAIVFGTERMFFFLFSFFYQINENTVFLEAQIA